MKTFLWGTGNWGLGGQNGTGERRRRDLPVIQQKEGLCGPHLGPGLRTKFLRSLDACQSGWKGTLAGRTHLLVLPLTGNPARFEDLKSWVDFLHPLPKSLSSYFPGRELPTERMPYNCGYLNLMVSETRVPPDAPPAPPEIWVHCSGPLSNPNHANSGSHTPCATNLRYLVLLLP